MGNIMNVKQAYNSTDWAVREAYYVSELSQLVIPSDPNTKDIMQLNAKIDAVIAEANLEFGYIDRNYQYYMSLMKNAEKECFSTVKNTQLAMGAKVTESDIKGLTVTYLKQNPIAGLQVNIYDMVYLTEKRHRFMEAVLSTLKSKRDSIVTINTMMKIESNV